MSMPLGLDTCMHSCETESLLRLLHNGIYRDQVFVFVHDIERACIRLKWNQFRHAFIVDTAIA